MNKQYPQLFNLLAGPFYQCWYEYDGRSADEILHESISESTSDEKLLAVKEIEKLVATFKDDEELGKVLGTEIGCNYSPSDDGLSNLEWLLIVKKALQ